MSGPGSGERRAFYRLRYPEAERPAALLPTRTFSVVELSELGARFLVADGEPAVGSPVVGYVRFRQGEAARIEGSVLRHHDGEAVLRLTLGVPLRRMIAEQQRLIRLYPNFPDTDGGPTE